MIQFELTIPPSANRMTRFVRGKGKVAHSSPEYRSWLKAASLEVMVARKGMVFSKPIKVLISLRKPHPLADLDNFSVAQVFDAMQRGGLITNDRIIHEFTARWVNHGHDRVVVCADDMGE